ncbi:MAG: cell division protein ZapA [Flavobacteriales bacterium]|nr:cell division protein ZapA [Flavobacteriales bacterium]
MGELSIKIKIANRVYPLTVKMDEEEGVRKAAEDINRSINEFERLYDVKDKQDLLAMAALKVASRNFELEKKGVMDGASIEEDLKEIDALLSQQL